MDFKWYVGCKLVKARPLPRFAVMDDEKKEDGYQVKYPDNYVSWSPKGAFEDAYRNIWDLPFYAALYLLQSGKAYEIHRRSKAYKISLGENKDCLVIHRFFSADVPYTPTQEDIFANDWHAYLSRGIIIDFAKEKG